MRKNTASPTISLLQIGERLESSCSGLSSPTSLTSRTSSPRSATLRRNSSRETLNVQQHLREENIERSRYTVTQVTAKRRPKPENNPFRDSNGPKKKNNTIQLVCSDLCFKLSDHLILGGQSRKVFAEASFASLKKEEKLTDSEKTGIVLADPKFGLFSLFLWHAMGNSSTLSSGSPKFFCAHNFSLTFALPLLLFATQWILYIALVSHEIRTFDGDFCPNNGTFETKLMMLGIGMIYFIRSFFIWDSLTLQAAFQKMNRMDNISAIMDTFQEFSFNILVYGANLWIIFVEDDIQNMILNSLAMEFLMRADNEFEEMYFANVPEAATNIYDSMYVSREENRKLVSKKRDQSFIYNSASCVLVLLYKVLVLVIFLFPVFCLTITFAGTYCK